MTHGRAEIHELLLANDSAPSRALGQNFVADGNTVRTIVRLAGVGAGQRVVEIGAGLGSLTLALVEAGARSPPWRSTGTCCRCSGRRSSPSGCGWSRPTPSTVDWSELLGDGGPEPAPWTLVANLPYNVAVPLVIRVLEEAPPVASLLVMVQREVGERLAAGAGDDAYGAVSVKVAYWATAAVVGRVSASVFIPRPRVESVLVRLVRRPDGRGAPSTAWAPSATSGSSPWSGPDSPIAGRCSDDRCATWSDPRRSTPVGIRRRPGPRNSGWRSGSAWRRGSHPRPAVRGVRSVTEGRPGPAELRAPAKLTLSLEVTGIRADGYHLLESEMVSLDLADTLIDRGRRVA